MHNDSWIITSMPARPVPAPLPPDGREEVLKYLRIGYVADDAAAMAGLELPTILGAAAKDPQLAAAVGGSDPYSEESIKRQKQAVALMLLCLGMRVGEAAKGAGTSEGIIHYWAREDPEFRDAYQAVRRLAKRASRPTHTKLTPQRVSRLLQRLREGSDVAAAAASVGATVGAISARRRDDAHFAAELKAAIAAGQKAEPDAR